MFEYKVVPAPKRGLKGKGVKGNEGRFANALQTVMNELGKDGWEYLRTDTLPAEEREGLMGRTTVFQNMLVFRRTLVVAAPAEAVAAEVEDETPLLEDKTEDNIEDLDQDMTETIEAETEADVEEVAEAELPEDDRRDA